MSRKVGRPSRIDDRQQQLTFYPANLRHQIKTQAALRNISMSDYLDGEIRKWLNNEDNYNIRIFRTHPRSGSAENWVSVQFVLCNDTLDKLKEVARRRDISVASLIYTISKNLVDYKNIINN